MKIKPKILLVNPPSGFDLNKQILLPPLGLAYIAAILEKNCFEVKILDLWTENLSFNQIKRYVTDFNPIIIGISSDITRGKKTLELMQFIKSINQDILTIVGGPFPTVYPKFFKKSFIDLIAISEGEYTFLEIAKNYPNKNYPKINGLCYTKEGKQIFTKPRPLIQHLDELPQPAWHLLPMKKYRFFSYRNISSLITSRGCPHLCIFCNTPIIFGRKLRTHSPSYVISMIKNLINNYKIKQITFRDSSFNENMGHAKKICDLIIKEKIKIKWICNARVDNINLNLLEKMKQAGCILVRYGAESGDSMILKKIKKNITVEQIENAVKLAKQAKLNVALYFVIGFPWDTKKSIKKTIRFAEKLGLDTSTTYFQFLLPLPKTELWDYCIKYDLIDKANIGGEECYFTPTIKLKNLSSEELINLKKAAYGRIRPLLKKLIDKLSILKY